MEFKVRGQDMPVVDIEMKEGESVYTESGGMSWMTPNVDMNSNVKGGLGGAFNRMLSGESLFVVNYKCNQGTGVVTFCNEFPGNAVEFEISENKQIICQRDSFMVAEDGVKLTIHLTKKLGAGFFGGEGLVLQKLSGQGKAMLEFAGEITVYDLKEGQELKVDPGYIGAFESTVNYDITRVKGIMNMLFSGEGLFLASLKGPGKVWLQSMPLANLAMKLNKYLPKKKS
ncbi:MAG: TIGR00266 family protein [Nanobdellota archaeon]